MLCANIVHRFTDGEIRECYLRASCMAELLVTLNDMVGDWEIARDEATTIRIMTDQVNGNA